MKSKKLLLALLLVQLVLCVALTAFAAEPELVFDITFDTVEPSGSIVNAGEKFTVAVTVTENPCFAALKGTFTFNPEYVTYESASIDNSVFTGANPIISDTDANLAEGKIPFIMLNWADMEAITNGQLCYPQTGILVEFTFTAKETISVDTEVEFGFATTPNNVIFVANYDSEAGVGDGPIYADSVYGDNSNVLIIGTEHEHTLVPATCLDNEYCSVCKVVFEDTALGHAWSEYKTDADKHWKECTNGCGTIDAEAPHALSELTCTEPSKCAECGYVAVEAEGHKFEVTNFDADNHWIECAVCQEIQEGTVEAHFGGTANCTDSAICEGCGNAYGDNLGGHLTDKIEYDETHHWFVCSREGCTESGEKTAHNGGVADCQNKAICKDCNQPYGEIGAHVWSEQISADENEHWYVCTIVGCTEKNGVEAHHGGTATCTEQAKCVDCGTAYGALLDHQYTILKNDATTHWYECVCGAKDTAVAHSGGNATCLKKAVCDVCSAEYGELGDHAPKTAMMEDEVPATCYSEGSYNEVVRCALCDTILKSTPCKIEKIAHTPGDVVIENVVNSTCTVEGSYDEVIYCTVPECLAEISRETKSEAVLAHEFTEAKHDETHHWNKCANCEAIDEKVAHFGGKADCLNAAVCDVCEQSYGKATGHDMAAATCTAPSTCKNGCGHTEGDKLAHEFGEWQSSKAPTTKEEGEEIRKCNNCSATETQSVAKLPTDYTWLIVAVILVLAAAGIVVVVVLKKKRK